MPTPAEDRCREFLFLLDKFKDTLSDENNLISNTVEVYNHKGLECKTANMGLRLFWVKLRPEIKKQIKRLCEIVNQLPEDTALDTDTFSYKLAERVLNEQR